MHVFLLVIFLCAASEAITLKCEGDFDCIFKEQCQARHANTQVLSTGRNRRCHSKKNLVCCPAASEQNIPSVSITTAEPPPEDFHQHKNFPLLPSNCGLPKNSGDKVSANKVSGGTEAERGAFPWMALLFYKKLDINVIGPKCGGSLLNRRYVLTAAHCLNEPGFELLHVSLGAHNYTEDCVEAKVPCSVNVTIEEQIIHQYDNSPNKHYNDIALLRLSRDISFTDHISAICLPFDITPYSRVVVAGWGRVGLGNPSPVLLTADVDSDGVCKDLSPLIAVSRTVKPKFQLCMLTNRKDVCQGDSGGPLMILQGSKPGRYYQVGIVSFKTSPCGTQGDPTIFTRVTGYLKWILDTIRE